MSGIPEMHFLLACSLCFLLCFSTRNSENSSKLTFKLYLLLCFLTCHFHLPAHLLLAIQKTKKLTEKCKMDIKS